MKNKLLEDGEEIKNDNLSYGEFAENYYIPNDYSHDFSKYEPLNPILEIEKGMIVIKIQKAKNIQHNQIEYNEV